MAAKEPPPAKYIAKFVGYNCNGLSMTDELANYRENHKRAIYVVGEINEAPL